MIKKDNIYKMGVNWAKRFVSPKKINAGWEIIDTEDGNQIICKPDGNAFALFEKKTGLVHTHANINEVQW